MRNCQAVDWEFTVRPSGEILNYQYDEARRLVAITNSLGETIEYTLDAAGNRTAEVVKSETGEIKRSITKSYDELSRLKTIVGATRQIASYVYDSDGNRVQEADGRSYTTDQSYDSLNRPAVTTDANLNTASVLYDELDRITLVVDQRGLATNYTYDVFDNLLVQTSPDTGTTTYTYDEAGNRLTATDARGVVTNYSYDALNRVTQVDYTGSPTDVVQYGYDSTVDGNYGIGRLTTIDDASGFTYYHYNHQGFIGQKTVGIGNTSYQWSYQYDPGGRLLSLRYPSGRIVRYARDQEGRISDVYSRSWEGAAEKLIASNFQYLPFGGLTSFTYGNGISQTFEYDQDYQLVNITSQGLNTVLQRGYGYDLSGNIASIDNGVELNLDQLFSYDPLSRLDSADGGYGDISYTYDAVGNRTSQALMLGGVSTSSTLEYDIDNNRLLRETDSSGLIVNEYGYDAGGNVTSQSSSGITLGYSDTNRLTSLAMASLNATYIHNALGQRVVRSVATGEGVNTLHFHYGDNAALLVEADAFGKTEREYIYAGSQLLAVLTPSSASDSDQDSLDDDWELQFFGDLSREGNADADGDGYSDLEEFRAGTVPTSDKSFPGLSIDSDNDGLRDTWEIVNFSTLDRDGAGDFDGDGVIDRREYDAASDPTVSGDSDNDGLPDSWELFYFANLLQNAADDFDADGLSNLDEYSSGSDPTVASGGALIDMLADLNPTTLLKLEEESGNFLDSGTFAGHFVRDGNPVHTVENGYDLQDIPGTRNYLKRLSNQTVENDPLELLTSDGQAMTIVFIAALDTNIANGSGIVATAFERSSGVITGFLLSIEKDKIVVRTGYGDTNVYHYAEASFPEIPLGELAIYSLRFSAAGVVSFDVNGQPLAVSHYSRSTSTYLPPPVPRSSIKKASHSSSEKSVLVGRSYQYGLNGHNFPKAYTDGRIGALTFFDRLLTDTEVSDLHQRFTGTP